MTCSMMVRRARAPVERLMGLLGDGVQGVLSEAQVNAVELEELAVLLDQGVLRLGQDADQGLVVQRAPEW